MNERQKQQVAEMEKGQPEDAKVANMGASLCAVQTMSDAHKHALRAIHDYIKTQPKEPAVIPAMLALMAAAQTMHRICEIASESLADLACAAGVNGNAVCAEAMRLSGIAEGLTSDEAKQRATKRIAEVDAAEATARAVIDHARMAPGSEARN